MAGGRGGARGLREGREEQAVRNGHSSKPANDLHPQISASVSPHQRRVFYCRLRRLTPRPTEPPGEESERVCSAEYATSLPEKGQKDCKSQWITKGKEARPDTAGQLHI